MWGWFAVTTQNGRAEDVNTELETIAFQIPDPNNPDQIIESTDHSVIRVRSILPAPEARKRVFSDEQRIGAFYNYARLGTWSHFAQNIVHAYSCVQDFRKNTRVQHHRDAGVQETVEVAIKALGVTRRFGYMDPEANSNKCLRRAVKAFICAVVIQGFTGWSAFVIAYRTPTVGIGCRSFSFLIYNILSLTACVLLILAAYLSDCRSWRIEIGKDDGWAGRQKLGEAVLRFLGKAIAFLNCVVILLSCALQFSGVFNSCYCGSNVITAGELGHIVFLSLTEQADFARAWWWMGFVMTGVPCLVVIGYFHFSKWDLPPYENR